MLVCSFNFLYFYGRRFHLYGNAYNQRLSQTETVIGGLDYKHITLEPHNTNNLAPRRKHPEPHNSNNLLDENKPASRMASKPSRPRWAQEASNKWIPGTTEQSPFKTCRRETRILGRKTQTGGDPKIENTKSNPNPKKPSSAATQHHHQTGRKLIYRLDFWNMIRYCIHISM